MATHRAAATSIPPIPPGSSIAEPAVYSSDRYRTLKAIAESHRKTNTYDRNSHEFKFWDQYCWSELKNEFYTEVDESGIYLYPRIQDFVKAKWRGRDRRYAMTIVGPYPCMKVPWEGCWQLERHEEHWAQDKRITRLADCLRDQASAGAVSYSLASLYVDEITKLKCWLDQLQDYSGGSLFKPVKNSTKKAKDEMRQEMKFVLSLQQKLLNMLDQVRTAVQVSVGGQNAIIATALGGLLRDAKASPMLGSGTDVEKVKELVSRMTEVAVAKADLYKVQLPEMEPIDVQPSNGKQKTN